jgi:hypothetical protein
MFTQYELLKSSEADSQRAILEFLSKNYPRIELNESAMNFSARIFNLYKKHPNTKGLRITDGDIINAAITSEWSSLRKITVDSTNPIINTSSAAQHPSTTTVTITGSVIEQNLESVSLKLDGTDVDSSAVTLTGNDFTAELQNLSVGNHTVEITATDKAGNKSAVRTHAFTVIDNTPPVVTPPAPVTPPIVVNPETPDPTPAEPTPSPQSQPAPTRTAYLQPAANTAQTTTDTPDDEEATVEVDALALNNSLSARAQDIRGTTDNKNPTPSLLGFAWYYWVIAALSVAVITLWGLLVGRRRKEEEQ